MEQERAVIGGVAIVWTLVADLHVGDVLLADTGPEVVEEIFRPLVSWERDWLLGTRSTSGAHHGRKVDERFAVARIPA